MLVDGGSLNDFTIPILALLYGKRFADMFKDFFGERHIEDMPLHYYAIATNLTQSCCAVHRSGFLWKAVASSMSVLGLAHPSSMGGTARGWRRGEQPSGGRDARLRSRRVRVKRVTANRDASGKGIRATVVAVAGPYELDQPVRHAVQVPSIMSVLMRTASLQLVASGAKGFADADLVFEPPSEGFRLLDWKAIDKIVESGYRCAVPVIENWQAEQRAASEPAASQPA